LIKPLLRRFEDASDACRGLAAEVALALLQVHPKDALALLPYVVPVLEERLNRRVRIACWGRFTCAAGSSQRACMRPRC
jgi:hypothetical protein